MARQLLWAPLLAIFLLGCEPNPRIHESFSLSDGTEIEVVKINIVPVEPGESGLLIEYITEIPINDIAQLRAEANRIWVDFRTYVEHLRFYNVPLANLKPPLPRVFFC